MFSRGCSRAGFVGVGVLAVVGRSSFFDVGLQLREVLWGLTNFPSMAAGRAGSWGVFSLPPLAVALGELRCIYFWLLGVVDRSRPEEGGSASFIIS